LISYNCIIFFYIFFFRTRDADDCKPFHEIVEKIFPKFLEVFNFSLSRQTEMDLKLIYIILRIYYKTIEVIILLIIN
jgi:hypothetical protein